MQNVFGLLCASDGCPVAVELFAGNTGDPRTLEAQVRKARLHSGIAQIAFVGDRGILKLILRVRIEHVAYPHIA